MADTAEAARQLHRVLTGEGAGPLEPDHPFYYPLLESSPEKDPVERLALAIDLAVDQSVHLLTGFRGNGKSTQLRRLRARLQQDGCRVFLVDMQDFVHMTTPIDLTDFTLSLVAALTKEVESSQDLRPTDPGFVARLWDTLQREVEVGDLKLKGEVGGIGAELGLRLATDASFKKLIQKRLKAHKARLMEEARRFVENLVEEIRRTQGTPDRKVVLLVDSLEQLRGSGGDAPEFYESVIDLFSGEAANLRYPKLHIVYTVPPYLLPLGKNLSRSHDAGEIAVWPNLHVRTRHGAADPTGLKAAEDLIATRSPRWERVLSRPQLHRLATASGGDLRDLFRLLREVATTLLIRTRRDPAATLDDAALDYVERALQNELRPASEQELAWLRIIHETKETRLGKPRDMHELMRFLDGNVVMSYANGSPWYDVHPLLVGLLSDQGA